MRHALNAAWDAFRSEEEAWTAIVTGAGRAFCAGVDLKDPAGATGDWPGSFWEQPTITTLESGMEIWKPTIAAVNGPCIGYGLTAVLACDFVLASERATFAYPEVRIGVPTIVGALRLPGRVAWPDALELLLTGETIDARRARRIGLAWKVVAHDELMAEARALADRLCAGAPLAVRATKEMAFVPLNDEQKFKGKAAIELIASRLGKSSSAFLQQLMVLFFGSLTLAMPWLAAPYILATLLWLVALNSLGKRYNTLVDTTTAG